MGWLTRLTGKCVALDTAPLVYFVEENPHFLLQVRPFFVALAQGNFIAFTSTLTITEALVKPLQLGLLERAHAFKTFLSGDVSIIPVTPEIAETAAQLRADYALRTPDAIQLATAITHNADFFLTNDVRLGRVKQLEVLLLSKFSI